MDIAEPFDRRLRRLRRDRAAPRFREHAFLRDHMVEELLARLATVNRRFSRALDLGAADGALGVRLPVESVVSADAGFRFASGTGGVQCDEDRLPFADGSFDLVVSAGALHLVNDLPGALALIRRVLKPDGLFLAAFAGGASLTRTRAALLAGDIAATDGAAPRIAPMVDVRAAGDLLGRAGFALPVVDVEAVPIRYSGLLPLLRDIRGAGDAGAPGARTPLGRHAVAAAAAAFDAEADADGRIAEVMEIIYLTAWSPSPDQPKPLRPGSGKVSLADVLRRPDAGI
ncbi:SAM-dependent methyltransferase [Tardibacter chloracetimidivorans]|uniref:SAM-dependent methyltransferase n=1 Tax=Tardibacter chloracetimidivorans TaxID=1921510 RepID=A0A1L3ZVC2_9SPHN|nr:class I SAM-dependent methyltransferase [Tardibacter chloracetimidivorans]API59565.1 SAM-dependent methyltransferase [Tardibacter chloracetimidivorans]